MRKVGEQRKTGTDPADHQRTCRSYGAWACFRLQRTINMALLTELFHVCRLEGLIVANLRSCRDRRRGVFHTGSLCRAPASGISLPLCFFLVFGCVLAGRLPVQAAEQAVRESEVVIKPKPYLGPLRNPLMGFIGPSNGRQECATLSKDYVKWNLIEQSASDGVDKLRAYANAHWKGVEDLNIKIIPRVFLEWPKGSGQESYWPILSYWPDDMPRDFTSAQFKERAVRMIEKMAFIERGMIGPWGEQHHPTPDAAMQKLLGEACKRAFKHKLVMNRYPWEFVDYDFGIYWDSFANPGWEMTRHVPELEGRLADRWKTAPMAGEMAFSIDPASLKPRLAKDPTEAVAEHADELIRYIRRWHWTALGWVSDYNPKNPKAAAGAARVQSAFGYRFVIEEARFPSQAEPEAEFKVSFTVRNMGSAPIYYNWPVELSLLDPKTRQPVWKANFEGIDIRKWLPGDFSDKGKGRPAGDKAHAGFEWDTGLDYDIAPASNLVTGRFRLPSSLQAGEYLVALAILDPAGNLPSVKFAVVNYFKGGRHPLGRIGIGMESHKAEISPDEFDDPQSDQSLRYELEP